jgi:integrase
MPRKTARNSGDNSGDNMAVAQYRFTAKQIDALPVGRHADGAGLYLYKLKNGYANWVFRYRWQATRREFGLGGYPKVSLANARKLAAVQSALLLSGKCPHDERKASKLDAAVKRERSSPEALEAGRLRAIVPTAFDAHKSSLKDDGNAGRWLSPLRVHVLPKLGGMSVERIQGKEIADTFRPIWHSKPDVARKAMSRLGYCLKYAKAMGHVVDRDAIDDAKDILGKQSHKALHIPAMMASEVPAFYATLGNTPSQLALRLLILTGARSKSVRFAHVEHVSGDVWTIPAPLMKGKKNQTEPFSIPLSDEAMRVIDLAKQNARDGFLFPSERKGVISDMSMTAVMRRADLTARPHGFRTSLRVWANEHKDSVSFEVREMVLAHKIGSSVSQSYDRDDYFQDRTHLMKLWAAHVVSGCVAQPENELRGQWK